MLLAVAVSLIAKSAMADVGNKSKLSQLAASHFNQEISPAEEELFEATANARDVDCTKFSGKDRIIRSDRLSWLCVNPDAAAQVTPRGISILGAEIEGELNLEWTNISFPLRTRQCVFTREIILRNSRLAVLDLEYTSAKAIEGEGLIVESGFFLRHGFKADGGIDLRNANIKGNLDCDGGRFVADGYETALNAEGARIAGSVFLGRNFKAEKRVDLATAKIGGDLDCDGGQFDGGGNKPALDADRAEIKGFVFMGTAFQADTGLEADIKFRAQGGVDLTEATIDKGLECEGGQFAGTDKALALNVYGAKVEGFVYLNNGFKAEGGVDLKCAKIGANLDCDGGQFKGTDKVLALNVNGAKVEGSVFLRNGFKAEGGVDLTSATIGVNLECIGGQFVSNGEVSALSANDAVIHGSVFLRDGFTSVGWVDLRTATIGGTLDCAGGQFVSKNDSAALDASGAKIQGFVILNKDFEAHKDFIANGGVHLDATIIGGDLDCEGSHFIGRDEKSAFEADSAKIDGSVYFRSGMAAEGIVQFTSATVAHNFQWTNVASPQNTILDLRYSKVGTLFCPSDSWPNRRNLFVDGLAYDQMPETPLPDALVQLEWLKRQPQDQFLSQPYEQLAAVLRKMGFQEEAVKVMIEKGRKAGQYAIAKDRETERDANTLWELPYGKKLVDLCWYKYLGKFIGYGYSPWNAFYASLGVVALGGVIFKLGYVSRIIIPTSETAYGVIGGWAGQLKETYPKFNALVYSLESFVPLVKLKVAEYWIPNANQWGHFRVSRFKLPIPGTLFRWYLWFHITAGWILTTLWVGAFTGLLKS